MYLTSFAHRDQLFGIAERWFISRPEPGDVRALTEILISDVLIIRETLEELLRRLLGTIHKGPLQQRRINFKGDLRDLLSSDGRDTTPRIEELFARYRKNPAFYYRETPINASVFLDDQGHILGFYRVKRPKRIAEKANRRIADWIFKKVAERATEMAVERARQSGIPIDQFITPERGMLEEFVKAEEHIAESFRDGSRRFDRSALVIQDVGALKIVADSDSLAHLEKTLREAPDISVIEKEQFSGNFHATNLILEVSWDPDHVCRQYLDNNYWEHYQNRGIPLVELRKGLEPFLSGALSKISVELILTTFPDLVESELGSSIHEERIISQRDNKYYKGYIPMNVEFLVEFLFAVGFSPVDHLEEIPIKIWGRYLPETLGSYIRKLYALPDHDFFG